MSVIQINPKEAFELLKNNQNSVLVDVRTFEELSFVGLADSEVFDDRMFSLPWQIFPSMQENPEFSEKLEDSLKDFFGNAIEEIKIVFMCRSGARSMAAANYALNLGYKNCYNLSGGFEGDLDHFYHRGNVNGWKAANLPWRQR